MPHMNQYADMLTALIIPICATLIMAIIATWAAIYLAKRLRFLDTPGVEAHKQQTHAVPYGGGIAMAVAVGIGLSLAYFLPIEHDQPSRPWLCIAAGALALLLVGFYDDVKRLSANKKLLAQAIIAGVVVYYGELNLDSLREWPILSYGLAWLWLVLVSNAYNLLDHDDALCGSIAVVSALVLVSGSLLSGDVETARIYLLIIAAILGFLWWNRPPARVYMGDAGSLALGFLIGVGTLMVTFWPSGESGSPLAILSPVLITALPLFDTASVVIKRLRTGQPIMRGDRNHISHRLQRLGLSPKRRLLTAIALQIALAAGALLLRSEDLLTAIVIIAQAGAICVVFILLETTRSES
jgi:UDP-GlcNAc:undecaprenyl-phosphate/decaprenyl-phosphate GlcNAc-1-phosphate transferase